MHFRFANPTDAAVLAPLNAQLICDEGHRNPMTIRQLTDRMSSWLHGEYKAVLFEADSSIVGYALYRFEPEFVYLRQLFVVHDFRRQGVGKEALLWLWANAFPATSRLRIEVLVENQAARSFWNSMGFKEYCITMEAQNAA